MVGGSGVWVWANVSMIMSLTLSNTMNAISIVLVASI